jgi:glycosyltransferase involved in cell wall biosynthesis
MSVLDPARTFCSIAILDDLGGADPPLALAARKAGFRCHLVPCRGRFDFGAVGRLTALAREEHFEIVHSHGYKADLISLFAASRLPVRTVATPHGWSAKGDWKLKVYEWADWASFALFDAVVPLSSDLRDGALRNLLARGKVDYIPNGVDLKEIDEAREMASNLAPLGQGPVIGYCGQLIRRKDLSTLLSAFAQWPRQDTTLILVGDGASRHELTTQAQSLRIANRVHFVGYTPDRLEWMARFDAFVFPSMREGIPRSLMEAMALGVPVIASAIAGNRDLVEHGVNGLLFRPGDAGDLCLHLDTMFRYPATLLRRQVIEARRFIEQRHSGQAMALAYEALFQRLAALSSS